MCVHSRHPRLYKTIHFSLSTMEHILLLVSISGFLFQFAQSANSTFDGLVSSDLSLSKFYEKSVKELVSERLSGKNIRIKSSFV